MSDETIPLSHVATAMHLSRPSLYAAIRNGEIPGGHQIGNRYVINRSVWEAWWRSGGEKPQPVYTQASQLHLVS